MLSALGSVARARGMADLADKAGVNRESLYKALSPGAKPRYDTIFRIVRALGVGMVFKAAPLKKAPGRKTAGAVPRRGKPLGEQRAAAQATATASRKTR